MGYDSNGIVNKVKDALLKVKNGNAAFERDSVAFDKYEYTWPVLTGLLWIAAQRSGKLSVLDFGGSLGSTYFQYKKFFLQLDIQWNIVEQRTFVECGKEYFEDTNLHFFLNAEDCFKAQEIDVVLLSSVLPYLEDPYGLLQKLIDLKPSFMIFDKMPFLIGESPDRLTVQTVHPSIYSASYPSWFFNEQKFLDFLKPNYELVEEFDGTDKANIPSVFKGLIFQRKK